MRNTPCECATAGWCERHQCMKPESLFHRCRRDLDLFQAWEEGRGPCFNLPGDPDSSEMPGLARRIARFGKATMRHVLNQLREVDDAAFEVRLAVCRECPSCDVDQMICREKSCGCFLRTKARWESENCPHNLWPSVESDVPH